MKPSAAASRWRHRQPKTRIIAGNAGCENPEVYCLRARWNAAVVVALSRLHVGVLIAEEIWAPPRFLIRVQGLLESFGYFLLVLIGVELLETLKAYLRRNVIHVHVVLEVTLIAMARKVIMEEPNTVSKLDFARHRDPDFRVGNRVLLRAASEERIR
jgi:hypothetical protein